MLGEKDTAESGGKWKERLRDRKIPSPVMHVHFQILDNKTNRELKINCVPLIQFTQWVNLPTSELQNAC